MKALVLIKITSLGTREAYRLLKELDSVVESYLVYGRYDAALILQAGDLEGIRQVIFSDIQPIPGVIDILPCIIAEGEAAPVENGLRSQAMRQTAT
ncbi:MAG: Lrp/AsnC ligand binding domain-containing protein [Chloroflexota bacterium]